MPAVTMPKLSDTMEEGKILRWLKHEGETVAVGDLLAEVETDKADMELESTDAGVLTEIKLGEGEMAPVGAVIALIGEGSARGEAGGAAPRSRAAGKSEPVPAGDAGQGDGARAPNGGNGAASTTAPGAVAPPRTDATKASGPATATRDGRVATPRAARPVKASPLARSLAADLGVDLAELAGSGPGARITRRDVEAAHAKLASPPASRPPAGVRSGEARPAAVERQGGPPPQPPVARPGAAPAEQSVRSDLQPAGGGVRRVALSRMRASIARRMAESKREVPHFYLTTIVDMDEVVRLRESMKELKRAAGVTYNHIVLKAVADSLAAFPAVNARFAGDAIELLSVINLGIATVVEEGLVVPVLHGVDRLSLEEVATGARALAEKAQQGGFSSAELSGGTFTVSNLGMFEVESFSAVINPPQAAVLAVGSVKQRPVVREGQLGIGYTMYLTLSCDHRVIDGALGSRFLADVKHRLEHPIALLLPAENA